MCGAAGLQQRMRASRILERSTFCGGLSCKKANEANRERARELDVKLTD